MSNNSWHQVLASQQGAGSALSNTSTPTSIITAQAKYILAANWFEAAGKKLRIKAHGKASSAASTPGTLTIDVRFGAIIVANGGASPTVAVSQSNVTWDLEIDLIVQAVGGGTSATVLGAGRLISLLNTGGIQLLPATSPAAGTGFDSTTSFAIDLFATWSAVSASNSIQCTDYELTSLN